MIQLPDGCDDEIDWAKDSLPDPEMLMYAGTPNYNDHDEDQDSATPPPVKRADRED